MKKLHTMTCEACRSDSPKVTQQELDDLLIEIPEWAVINEEGIKKLQRLFTFPNFKDAMHFSQQVGELAEQFGHHPAILTEWGKVTITWWTHKIKGLHTTDFIMAAKTDNL